MYVAAIVLAPSLPGADKFLRAAKARGRYKMALVTASKAGQVEAILKHQDWQQMFDIVVTSEDFTKHKPNPEPFQTAMKKLDASPDQCIVFEDSKNGAQAGAAAGCYVIGLQAGNAKPQDLGSASQIVGTFSDISL